MFDYVTLGWNILQPPSRPRYFARGKIGCMTVQRGRGQGVHYVRKVYNGMIRPYCSDCLLKLMIPPSLLEWLKLLLDTQRPRFDFLLGHSFLSDILHSEKEVLEVLLQIRAEVGDERSHRRPGPSRSSTPTSALRPSLQIFLSLIS